MPAYPPKQIVAAFKQHLSALDVDADLHFKRLNWRGFYLEDGALRSRADSGHIVVDEILLNTIGDTILSLAGTINIDDQRESFAARRILWRYPRKSQSV